LLLYCGIIIFPNWFAEFLSQFNHTYFGLAVLIVGTEAIAFPE